MYMLILDSVSIYKHFMDILYDSISELFYGFV